MVYKQYHRVAKCGLTISMLKVKSIGKGRDYCEKLFHEIVVFSRWFKLGISTYYFVRTQLTLFKVSR